MSYLINRFFLVLHNLLLLRTLHLHRHGRHKANCLMLSNTLKRIHVIKLHWHFFFTPKTFFFLRLCLFRHLMIDLWKTSCMSTQSRTTIWCVIHKIMILLLQNWSLLRWEMFFFTIILIFTIIFFSKIFLTRCKLVKFFLRDFQASWTLKRLNLIRPTLR